MDTSPNADNLPPIHSVSSPTTTEQSITVFASLMIVAQFASVNVLHVTCAPRRSSAAPSATMALQRNDVPDATLTVPLEA